jgi:taurine dioxygenase
MESDMSASMQSSPDEASLPFSIAPLSPTIGAEISGVDLSEPLRATLRDAIYSALLDWKVIFFRDQDITTEQHLAFAKNFGDLEIHPFAPADEDHPEVLKITHNETHPGRENLWHSDVTWRAQPSLGSVLRCYECPEVGGDTLFADMYAAFDGLSDELKQQALGATATHDFEAFRRGLRSRGASDADIASFDEQYPNPQHPVIRTHPDTGRNGIYVNAAFTKHIVGMPAAASDELLQALYNQANTPEYQCRFQWRPNSIAFWDNRACQHYATSDYWPSVRRMQRVTIVGDTPYFTAAADSAQSEPLAPGSPELNPSATAAVGSRPDTRFRGTLSRRGRQQNG